MKMNRCFRFLFPGVFMLAACQIIDPAEEIPSYIKINSISLSTISGQGSNSHKITDAWIYVDGELIGGFELPCTVPVLKEGHHTISVRAGIKQNGMASLRAIYPFYQSWESDVQLTRASATEVFPEFSYLSGTNFVWSSDFEMVGTSIDDISQNYFPELLTISSSSEAFEGNSAFVTLTETQNYCHLQSADSFLVNPNQEMYLELDYKSEQPFEMGISYNDVNSNQNIHIPWIEIEPTVNWNKIYIRLNDAFVGLPLTAKYHVYFKLIKPTGLNQSTVWFDNLKWIN